MGTNGPRFLSDLLSLARQAVFETATSPAYARALSCVEVTRTFTTPETLAAGIGGPSAFPLLCHLSYRDFRHWRDSNPQPLCDVTRAFTTPQTHRKFFLRCNLALLVPLGRSPLPTHELLRPCNSRTPIAPSRQLRFAPPRLTLEKNPGGINVHGLSGLEPEPYGLSERSTRELHHPGTLIPR